MHIAACRKRNAEHIVEKCPEQVLMYIGKCSPAKSDCCRYIAQSALHKHYISCIYRNICTCTYSDAYICTGKCRCIIDAVSHHDGLAMSFKLPDHRFLAVRKHTCDHFIYTYLLAYSICSALIVTC